MGGGVPKRRKISGAETPEILTDTNIESAQHVEAEMVDEGSGNDGPVASVELSSAARAVSREERNRLISDLIRLMLFHHTEGPVKRADVIKLVMKDYARVSGLTNFVIDQARLRLFNTFGYNLIEFTKEKSANITLGNAASARRHAVATADVPGAAVKLFCLENALNAGNLMGVVFSERHNAEIALRTAACAIVNCGGDKLEEETFWTHLQSLGVQKNMKDHPDFGDVEKFFDALVKQRYLIKERSTAGAVYRLGEKAKLEIGVQELHNLSRHLAGPDSLSG